MNDKTITGEELGLKLLESVRQMKAGKVARATHVEVSLIVATRNATGLSQDRFEALLGVEEPPE